MTGPQLRLLLFLGVVLGFAAWALGLTWSVRGLRDQVEEQVGWQIATSAWERSPGPGSPADTMEHLLPAIRARLATDPASRDLLDSVEASLASHDPAAQQAAAQRLSPLIRRANASVSADLGSRWDQVTLLVFLALAFAFASVLLQALRIQDQEARATSERALRAAEDRLSRVGVGLLCIDDENHVHAANEVARGIAATRSSVDEWWKQLDSAMRRPGTVPCQVCGQPVHLGRCEVADATRMGQRVVEVVFGGHAHDLEHGDKLVVLVRDITDQQRRRVQGNVLDRLADSRDLARGVARALGGRSMRLVRSLRRLEGDDGLRLEEPLALADELSELGQAVGLLADDGSGPCDVARICRAAADLVRPQLADNVELRLDLPVQLAAHVRPARFAQALFAELLHAAEACAGGAPRQVHVEGSRDGSHVRVEVRHDGAPSTHGPHSGTGEMFQAAGATFVRKDTGDRHVSVIRATAAG